MECQSINNHVYTLRNRLCILINSGPALSYRRWEIIVYSVERRWRIYRPTSEGACVRRYPYFIPRSSWGRPSVTRRWMNSAKPKGKRETKYQKKEPVSSRASSATESLPQRTSWFYMRRQTQARDLSAPAARRLLRGGPLWYVTFRLSINLKCSRTERFQISRPTNRWNSSPS